MRVYFIARNIIYERTHRAVDATLHRRQPVGMFGRHRRADRAFVEREVDAGILELLAKNLDNAVKGHLPSGHCP